MHSYYENWRAYHAANRAVFSVLDGNELVKVAETFARLVNEKAKYRFGYEDDEIRYAAIVAAVRECCDESVMTLLIAEVERTLNESEHRPKHEPVDREKRRRGRKPSAWQDRMDESYGYIHWGHRTSKCWKDQSKRKRQWK